jgi:hypothetical protein
VVERQHGTLSKAIARVGRSRCDSKTLTSQHRIAGLLDGLATTSSAPMHTYTATPPQSQYARHLLNTTHAPSLLPCLPLTLSVR